MYIATDVIVKTMALTCAIEQKESTTHGENFPRNKNTIPGGIELHISGTSECVDVHIHILK